MIEFPTGLAAEPEWKQFLRLAEQLLQQPTAADQCRVLLATILQTFAGSADVWLAQPFYPLPGEPEVKTLPSDQAPALVQEAFETHAPAYRLDDQNNRIEAAYPLRSEDNLLGVLQFQCPENTCMDSAQQNFIEGMALSAALAMQASRQAVIKHWRYEQLALVRSVTAQIANVNNLDQLSERVTRLIQDTFDYYYVGLFTLEDTHLLFRASASQTNHTWQPQAFTIELGLGMTGSAAQSGEEILAGDVRSEPRYRYSDALPETQSEFALPLKVENRVVGVLDIQSDQLHAFHEIDLLVLRALADSIALAIEGTRLYRTVERRAEQISAVLAVSHALSSILDLDHLLSEVVRVISEAFGYPYVHIFTVHPGRRKVFYRAGSGERAGAYQEHGLEYDLDDSSGIIPYVARSGQTLQADDVSREEHYRPSALPPFETNSELAIPVVYNNQVLAVLDIQSDQANAFDANDRIVLEALSASVAVAIRNANLYRSEAWRRQVADSFRDVAGLLSGNIELEDLLQRILQALENNLPCDASAIWLVDEGNRRGTTLRLAAASGVDGQKIEEIRNNSPEMRAWLDEALLATNPVIRKPDDPFGLLGTALDLPPGYSAVTCPLRAGGRPLGTLSLAHPTSGRYGSEASDMVETFASYAAVAIQNARLFNESQEQAWISTVLLQVAEANQAVATLEDLMGNAIRLIPLLLGVTQAAIFLWDEGQQVYQVMETYGLNYPQKGAFYQESDLPALVRLKATRSTLFIHDPSEELNLPELVLPIDTGTVVLLPLLSRGEVIGAVLVGHQASDKFGAEQHFSEQMLAILQGVAHQTALSLENIRLVEARQEEAYVTAVLLQVAQAVVTLNNLDDILDTIVHLMPILVGIDACIVFTWDQNRQMYIPSKAFSGIREEERELLLRTYAPGEFELLDHVREHDQFILCPLSDTELSPSLWPELPCLPPGAMPTAAMAALGSWLIGVPLTVKGVTYGILLARENSQQPGFRSKRLEIITGVAQEVALAIQNEHLQKEMVVRERMEREIQLAREIQRTFLPDRLPKPDGWEIDARWQTARQVGGDFYDLFPLRDHHLGIVIADVADKGMPAALYMTVTRTLIRASVQHLHSPAKVLERVNHLLAREAENGMFVTALYAVLSLKTGELIYASAGHNRPYRLTSAHVVEQLQKGGMALGVMEQNHLVDQKIQLDPGDTLILYTDGVTDTFALDGSAFGEERLQEVLSCCPDRSAEDVLNAVDRALAQFRQSEPLSDDITMLAVRRK